MEPIYLTKDQCRYLHLGPSAGGAIEPQGDLAITDISGDGMILVEQASAVGEEGSGVWVGANGYEYHNGPIPDSAKREWPKVVQPKEN